MTLPRASLSFHALPSSLGCVGRFEVKDPLGSLSCACKNHHRVARRHTSGLSVIPDLHKPKRTVGLLVYAGVGGGTPRKHREVDCIGAWCIQSLI